MQTLFAIIKHTTVGSYTSVVAAFNNLVGTEQYFVYLQKEDTDQKVYYTIEQYAHIGQPSKKAMKKVTKLVLTWPF